MDTKKLRQKILDLAIRGKLVPQDPNDEPASVLLERIRAEKQQLIKEGKIKASKVSKACDTSHYEKIEGPFEIPQSWEWVKILDVLSLLTDGTHNSPTTFPSGSYKYITAKNIKAHGIALENITYVSEDVHKEIYSRCNPEYGDILYIKDGATCGVATINDLTEPFSLLSSVALLKPVKLISNKYLLFYLQSDFCYRSVRESMKGVGITRITLKQMEGWKVPMPPKAEQDRIVQRIESLLKSIDSIQSDSESLIGNIKFAKSKILGLAIKGRLVPQDPSDEPAIELLRRINPDFKPCDNSHYPFEVPENWELCHLGELFNHNTGKALNASNKNGVLMRYITTSNLYWDRFELSEVREMLFIESEIDKCRVIKGDLLVCEGGDVGRSAIWPYDDNIMIQNHIHKLRPKDVINVRFYLYVLMVYKQIGLIGGKGIGILGLSSRELDKLIIPVPPIEEQHRITEYVDELFSKISYILGNIN